MTDETPLAPPPIPDWDGTSMDDEIVDRYARAIVRIVERGHSPESDELRRATNTYATAFSFLVMRRGEAYALAHGRAAEARAIELLPEADGNHALALIAEAHERVSRET